MIKKEGVQKFMQQYLVESALLTHGLKSITNEHLIALWKSNRPNIVWIENGEIVVGDINEFCDFRSRATTYARINYFNFESCIAEKKSGCLTASGTMKVCEMMGIPITVTCGIGGIMEDAQKEKCHDIEALAMSNVSLLATSPKDMFNLKKTIEHMKERGVFIYGIKKDSCDSYLFQKESVLLDGKWNGTVFQKKTLYLNGIPSEKRIKDNNILKMACEYGREKERAGQYFHPAVNKKIDEMTEGYSSEIQLESLWENVLILENNYIN